MTATQVLAGAEWCSTVMNLAFTAAIAYERRWGWVLGAAASAIGVWLYLRTHTWALAGLNGYYVVMAIYGWWAWGQGTEDVRYHHRSGTFHVSVIASGLVLAFLAALALGRYLNGSFPHADAFITVFSLAATWMMTRKVVENWLYFIGADLVAIWLNAQLDYRIYAVQYGVYVVLSIAGFVRWSKALRQQASVV